MEMIRYATKSEIVAKANKSVQDFWPVAVDFGFSGVKGFSPNKVFCFPNIAVHKPDYSPLVEPSDTEILLKDEDGVWVIGERANEILTKANVLEYEAEMYERNRYDAPSFKKIVAAALGLAISVNSIRKYKGETIAVQTGLPPEYRTPLDDEAIKEAISGDYRFEMKIGKGNFKSYHFVVKEDNVMVMDQPMGSLFSAITDNNGSQSQADYAILTSNTIVCDPGFVTFDTFSVFAGARQSALTNPSLGMHEVFSRTLSELKEKGVNISVMEMQKALKKGFVTSFDRKSTSNRRVEFGKILNAKNEEVCMEAIQKVLVSYDYLQEYDNLILTGGTGESWAPYFEKFFANMETLTVITANRKDPSLSNVYSNARGYYLYLVGVLTRRRR